MCFRELFLGDPLEDASEELGVLPALYPHQIRLQGTLRGNNINGARYLTAAVQRSVQATFCRILGQTGTSLAEVPQSQLANCLVGPASQRPSSL